MTPALLLAAAFAAPPESDVQISATRGAFTLETRLAVRTAAGPLAARQDALLADYAPAADGSGLLDRLVPDGRLLRVEIAPPSPHAEPLTRAIFTALDADGSGDLSADEIKNAAKVLLARFDADGDDGLTPLEIVPDLLTREPLKPLDPPLVAVKFPGDPGAGGLADVRLPRDATTVRGAGQTVFIAARPANPVVVPDCPKSLLRPGREKDRDRFNAVAKEIVTLTIRPQPPGWFEVLDADGDGQLSLRELRNAPKAIGTTGGAGPAALPDFAGGTQISVSVSPGAATRPPVRLTKAPPPPAGPAWFRALDRNGDGDVSRREFAGTDARFKQYDADGDGLISAAEADAGDRAIQKGK